MTDYCKVRLIGKMVSDVIEFTDWSKDNMDALVVCIQTVVEYDGEDYQPLFNDDGDQYLYIGQEIGAGRLINNTEDSKANENYPES